MVVRTGPEHKYTVMAQEEVEMQKEALSVLQAPLKLASTYL